MEIVERILAKVAGQEVTAEELELVSGGRPHCPYGMYHTYSEDEGWHCDD